MEAEEVGAVAKEQAQQTNIVEVVVVRGSRDGRSCRGWSNAKTGGGAIWRRRASPGAPAGAPEAGRELVEKKRVSRSMKAAECKKGNEKGKGGAKRTGSPLLLCREKRSFGLHGSMPMKGWVSVCFSTV